MKTAKMMNVNKYFLLTTFLSMSLFACDSSKSINGVYTTVDKKVLMHIEGNQINIYFSPVALHCSSFEILSQEKHDYKVLNLDRMRTVSYQKDTMYLNHQNNEIAFGEFDYKLVVPIKADSIVQYQLRNRRTIKQTIYKDYQKFNVLAIMITLKEFEGFPKHLIADNIYTNYEMYLDGKVIANWGTTSVPMCLDLYAGYFPELEIAKGH